MSKPNCTLLDMSQCQNRVNHFFIDPAFLHEGNIMLKQEKVSPSPVFQRNTNSAISVHNM